MCAMLRVWCMMLTAGVFDTETSLRQLCERFSTLKGFDMCAGKDSVMSGNQVSSADDRVL